MNGSPDHPPAADARSEPRPAWVRTGLALAGVTLASVAAGIGAFSLAKASGEELGAARSEGAIAGRRQAAVAREAQGYAAGLGIGRKKGFRSAYARAYKQAYTQAFVDVGLTPPPVEEITPFKPDAVLSAQSGGAEGP